MPGELEIISRLRQRARAGPQVRVGIGDDAAVIATDGAQDLLTCCDLMIEGVHFRRDWAAPRLIGRKALAVTLSDIAAMGGTPRYAMISIALPRTLSSNEIEQLFDGIYEMAEANKVAIIGGDTSSSNDCLFIDTIVLGDCAAGRAITRAGAQVGDVIYVTGALGASALGLNLLERGFRLADADSMAAQARHRVLMKHLAPEPRLQIGRRLGERGLAMAMIDLSDGLSTDLGHLLEESHCGAILHATAIPIDESARWLAANGLENRLAIDPLQLALHGGEEYELLFTARPETRRRIATLASDCNLPITAIGEIVAGHGLQLERDGARQMIQPAGYEHRI
jgi:thiamine-monophosphate kinase